MSYAKEERKIYNNNLIQQSFERGGCSLSWKKNISYFMDIRFMLCDGNEFNFTLPSLMAALAFIPQALAGNITALLVGRFLLGLFIGGMVPSLNVLVKKLAPTKIQGTVYGLNSSSLF
ncbi:hypothetical protein GCM10020331_061550 [Ectobacillus funiculus]